MTARTIPALANFRDLGGLPTDDACRTKRGILYRSDAPLPGDRPPSESPWPPRAVIDLRSVDEAIEPHPLHSPDTVVVRLPLLDDARPKALWELQTGADVSLRGLYQQLTTRAGEAVRGVLELLIETDGPVLVHCAAGKDRTGVLVALLLRAAGVTREAVIADYVRTAAAMTDVRRRMSSTGAEFAALIAEFPDAIAAPAEAIGDVLDRVDGMPGGTFAWLVERGVPADLVALWKLRFVSPAPATV